MATDIQLARPTRNPLDEQKLADRAAIVGALRTPAAIAADVATLPYRGVLSGLNALGRGINIALPEGTNIPTIPNAPGMMPFYNQTRGAQVQPEGSWGVPVAKAAMPATAPAPLVPAAEVVAAPKTAKSTALTVTNFPMAQGTIEKTVLNADGTPSARTVWGGAPPPMMDTSAAGTKGKNGLPGGVPQGLIDPGAAASAGADRHITYAQQMLPLLMEAARNAGDPRNTSYRMNSIMRAFGNMDFAREYAGGANNINSGMFGVQQAGIQQAGQIVQTGMRNQTQRDIHATDSVPLGTELGTDPVTKLAVPLTTYGPRGYGGAAPKPYDTTKAKSFTLGMVYQHGTESRRYGGKDAAGKDIWEAVE